MKRIQAIELLNEILAYKPDTASSVSQVSLLFDDSLDDDAKMIIKVALDEKSKSSILTVLSRYNFHFMDTDRGFRYILIR